MIAMQSQSTASKKTVPDSEMSTLEPRIRISDVTLSYGALQIIGGISVDIAPGETISVIGPSGCGKTTLLRMLAALLARHPAVWSSMGRSSADRIAPSPSFFRITAKRFCLGGRQRATYPLRSKREAALPRSGRPSFRIFYRR